MLERVFSFFDQHVDVPYIVLSVSDGLDFRNQYRPPGTPRLIKDGNYVPEMPDSSALFVLARRERVEAVRPFVFADANDANKNMLAEELNEKGFARKLGLTYLDLSETVPKPQGTPSRTPTVAEWLQATAAFAKRDDIYPQTFSVLHPFRHGPSKDFKPTPWFPIPWNKDQLAEVDRLPTLGYLHRPVFVPMVDKDGKPLTRRDERTAALAAGWQQALQTLPEAERKAAPARVIEATAGSTEQAIALASVLSAWTEHGGPEIDKARPTQWIDTDARLGNTGAATWFMQMAIGVMGSYRDGGASAAINLRDPAEASIVFISPPPDAQRKSQQHPHGGDVFRHYATPAVTRRTTSRSRSAMPQIIRLGDPTDHGGQVTGSGAPRFRIGGQPVALKGDPCSCPRAATAAAPSPRATPATRSMARPWPTKATRPPAAPR